VTPEIAASAVETVSIEKLHRHMGHIAPDAAEHLVKDGLVEGIKLDNSTNIESCASCKHSKATWKPDATGDLIHLDVWGPSPMETINRHEYYSSFTDDHTRWSRLYLQHTKNAMFDSNQVFEA
jgi:hypothetical protein